MRIHTLQGLYLYVENLLQAIISLVKTRNSCKLSLTRVILFFVPKHHMSILCLSLFTGNLPPSRVSSSLTSYSCLLLPCSLTCRKGDKYGTGEKRMPWGTLHQQRQTVLRHCFSEHIGQIWNPQPIFQGLHRTERNITYQTIGRAEKSMLRFEGFIDCLSFLTLRLENCPQSPISTDRTTWLWTLLAMFPRHSMLWAHPLLPWQWPCRNGSPAANQKEYNNTRHIRNVSHIYGGCKDLNEYLQKQAAAKKQAQSIKVKTPPNKPGGFRL